MAQHDTTIGGFCSLSKSSLLAFGGLLVQFVTSHASAQSATSPRTPRQATAAITQTVTDGGVYGRYPLQLELGDSLFVSPTGEVVTDARQPSDAYPLRAITIQQIFDPPLLGVEIATIVNEGLISGDDVAIAGARFRLDNFGEIAGRNFRVRLR